MRPLPTTLLALLTLLVAAIGPASAEILPDFDPHQNTWRATHIVVVEGGKVVESWKGDLKAGTALPEGAARFTRVPVPGPSPWPRPAGEKPPAVSGKRMILFLAHVPEDEGDSNQKAWTPADSPGHKFNEVTATATVAWVEGDQVYAGHQPINPGGYALTPAGGLAGFRQRVDLGLALRALFDAARAEPDFARRADRLAVLMPVVSKYAGFYAEDECIDEVRRCGKAGVPVLAGWAEHDTPNIRNEAIDVLFGMGTDGFDAAARLIDDQARSWVRVGKDVRAGRTMDQMFQSYPRLKDSAERLVSLLRTAHRMRPSANRDRLVRLQGLKGLDELFTARPELKPEKSALPQAHQLIQDIRAGRFPADR